MKILFAQQRLLIPLLALTAAVTCHCPALAGPVTYANISDCVNSGDDVYCENKLSVSFDVSYGAGTTLETAYMFTWIDKYGSHPALENPIQFRVSKTLPVWSYPLRYLHTVDYAPREELIKVVSSRPGIAACVDGVDATAPTCGWQLDTQGNKIADSQGFCSNRDLLRLKTDSDPNSWWRGEKELGSQSALAASFSIAHCLRPSGVSYRGYEIDPPRLDYQVMINVFKVTDLITAFSVAPDNPVYLDRNGDHPIKAQLIGEAMPPHPPADLSGFILYLPSAPANDPKVLDWKNNMLLVPRTLVSRDGSECDKVGTSHTPFRRQFAVADKSVAGACLGNQLKQLHEADLARLAANPEAETEYLLSGKKLFKEGLSTMSGLALKIPSREAASSTIGLEMYSAQIGGVVSYEASAWIKEVTLLPHASLSREGLLTVKIENMDSSAADYMVAVHDCEPGIETAATQVRSIAGSEIATFTFPIRSSVDMEGSHYCWVTLQSPQTARVYDELQVFFDTHPLLDKASRQWQLKNSDSTVKP